jgi:hypothetical protein
VVLADLRGHVGVAVDDLGGAQPEQVLMVLGEAWGDDIRARCRGELNEEAADTTGGADDEDGGTLRGLERIEGGERRNTR